jgi:hypothetical protein
MSKNVKRTLLLLLTLLAVAIVATIAIGDATILLIYAAVVLATIGSAIIQRATGGMKGPPGPYGGGVR